EIVAAFRDQPDVTVAARRRLRRRFGTDFAALGGLAAALGAAGTDIRQLLVADANVLVGRCQVEVEDLGPAPGRGGGAGALGPGRVARSGAGRFAEGQLRLATEAALAGQFLNVLLAETPGAAILKRPDLALASNLLQGIRRHLKDLGCLFKCVI